MNMQMSRGVVNRPPPLPTRGGPVQSLAHWQRGIMGEIPIEPDSEHRWAACWSKSDCLSAHPLFMALITSVWLAGATI